MKKSTVDPTDFTLLVEHHVLAVDGDHCSVHKQPKEMVDTCTGWSNHVACKFGPDPDLLALVGKACETCRGSGREFVNGELAGVNPERDRCQDCHGTGSALLTVTTDVCPSCLGESALVSVLRCDDCDDYGTGSVRVRLTGQPVPVVDGRGPEWDVERQGSCVMVFDPPYEQAPGVTWVTAHYVAWGEYRAINLGPNSASLIGRWAWLHDALEVVG